MTNGNVADSVMGLVPVAVSLKLLNEVEKSSTRRRSNPRMGLMSSHRRNF